MWRNRQHIAIIVGYSHFDGAIGDFGKSDTLLNVRDSILHPGGWFSHIIFFITSSKAPQSNNRIIYSIQYIWIFSSLTPMLKL